MKPSVRRALVIALVAGVLLFGTALAVILPAYSRSNPEVVIPPENRHRFARVAILIDGTSSVGDDDFAMSKEVVRRSIVPNLGPNDVALCYDVRPGFTTSDNGVFGLEEGKRMPLDPESQRADLRTTLDRNRERKVVEDAVYPLIRKLASHRRRVEEVRRDWAERVRSREAPPPGGSDICGPLHDLGGVLADGDPAGERWLFLLSDLRDEARGGDRNRICRGQPIPAGTRILLIHPHDPDDPQGTRIERAWRDLFQDRKVQRMTLSSALTNPALLPPNPTAGLEQINVPAFGEEVRPRLVPALLAWAALTGLLSWGVLALLAFTSPPPPPSPTAPPPPSAESPEARPSAAAGRPAGHSPGPAPLPAGADRG
jgi:hypothetical protein